MVRSNNCRAHVLHLKVVDMVPVLIWSRYINAVGAELTTKATAPRNVAVDKNFCPIFLASNEERL